MPLGGMPSPGLASGGGALGAKGDRDAAMKQRLKQKRDVGNPSRAVPVPGGRQPAAAAVERVVLLDGAWMEGSVKSYSDGGGYGFINVTGEDVDIYFRKCDLAEPLQGPGIIRSMVRFRIRNCPDGRWRAEAVEPHTSSTPTSHSAIFKGLPAPAPGTGRQVAGGAVAAAAPVEPKQAPRPTGWGVHRKAEVEEAATQLTAMGFRDDEVHAALAGGLDVGKALDLLLSRRNDPAGAVEAIGHGFTLSPSSPSSTDVPDSLAGADSIAFPGPSRDPSREALGGNYDCQAADWQVLFGAREMALPVASGAGLTAVPKLGAASQCISEATEAVLPIVRQEHLESSSALSATPLARLARMKVPWSGGGNENQLNVPSGCVLCIKPETVTEAGWVYVERLCGRGGWVPSASVQELQADFKWMYTMRECGPMGASGTILREGDVVLVAMDSEKDNGLVYVERSDGSGNAWLSRSSFHELPESLRWVKVNRSCEAIHETQLSVQDGSVILVDVQTCTKEGWTYARATDVDVQAGWVPASCIDLPKD